MNAIKIQVIQSFQAADKWFEKKEEIKHFKPGAHDWNIALVLEHIVLSNHYLVEMLLENESAIENKSEIIGVRGSFAWPHPSRLQPKDDCDEKYLRFLLQKQFRKCLGALKEMESKNEVKLTGRDEHIEKIVLQEKKLQYLLFLSLHMKRHLEQMQKLENIFLMKA